MSRRSLFLGCTVSIALSGALRAAQDVGHGADASAPAAASSCVRCHAGEARAFELGVHARAGVTCVTCHGGDASASELPAAHGAGIAALSDARAAVETCGGCHAEPERMRSFGLRTDALDLYRSSAHGALLALDAGARVATCVSCHGAHDVFAARDPLSPVAPLRQPATCGSCHADAALMAQHELDPGVPAAFESSVHGRALLVERRSASPTCSSCHGAHGATPPRVDELGRVCGQCHAAALAHFEAGPHGAAARAGGLQECISCHGDHGIAAPHSALFTGAEAGHCGACHADDAAALGVGGALRDALDAYDARIVETHERLERAARRGLFLGEEERFIDEARAVRVAARPSTHELSPDALAAFLARGDSLIEAALTGLRAEERDLRDRRIFTALFLLVSAALAGLLLLYRREIAGGWRVRGRARAASKQRGH